MLSKNNFGAKMNSTGIKIERIDQSPIQIVNKTSRASQAYQFNSQSGISMTQRESKQFKASSFVNN